MSVYDALMPTPAQDLLRSQQWPQRTMSIAFRSPAHLKDSLAFTKTLGQDKDLWAAISRVASLFVHDACGTPGGTWNPEEPDKPIPPRAVALVFSPDSHSRPSFVWSATELPDEPGAKPVLLLHGGLIYRGEEGWTIHT